MFTGIIESTAIIIDAAPMAAGRRLRVDLGPAAAECKPGDSISISGVCLTASFIQGNIIDFDVVGETLARTTLSLRRPGDRVNVERSLRVGDRLDGHFVQGHVDGTAVVEEVDSRPGAYSIRFGLLAELIPFVFTKGSIALDGVSLTIAQAEGDTFTIALIPTTLQRTTLGELKPGDRVNVETDVLIRAVVHNLPAPAAFADVQCDSMKAGFA